MEGEIFIVLPFAKYDLRFESRVIADGSQSPFTPVTMHAMFESRLIADGSQSCVMSLTRPLRFESRVIADGSQRSSVID